MQKRQSEIFRSTAAISWLFDTSDSLIFGFLYDFGSFRADSHLLQLKKGGAVNREKSRRRVKTAQSPISRIALSICVTIHSGELVSDMLDHITIGVTDLDRSRNFYDLALRPLGIERLYAEGEAFAGYGIKPKAFFWIGYRRSTQTSAHVAFKAQDRATVRLFHEAALRAGGSDNGPPGLRPHYHANYYGAFVLDPDGHNVEAVCHSEAAETA